MPEDRTPNAVGPTSMNPNGPSAPSPAPEPVVDEETGEERQETREERYMRLKAQYADQLWICICIDCQSPNRADAFIRAGEFGVCRFCGGKTKEVLESEYKRFKELSKTTGFRGGPAWSTP